jgi:hypothetical protein
MHTCIHAPARTPERIIRRRARIGPDTKIPGAGNNTKTGTGVAMNNTTYIKNGLSHRC